MANGLNTVITSNADATSEALNKLNTFMNDRGQMDLEIENKLNDLKVKNLDALKERELNNRLEIEKQLLAKGFTNEDLKDGMVLTGTVRNVIDFGCFVDIGVKYDGLVHISEMSDKYIKNPAEIVSVGDIVKVKVIKIDQERHKVGLSMKI